MLRRDARKSSLMGRRTLLAIAAATAGPMFFSLNWKRSAGEPDLGQ